MRSQDPKQGCGRTPRFDVGVLFVHGIGQHKRGETLVRSGDPLIQWLKSWLEHGDTESLRILDAQLVDFPEDPGAPAHVEFLLEYTTGSSGETCTSRWLLAESWWSRSFTAPRYGDLVFWSLQVLPFTLVAHFDRRVQRASVRLSELIFAKKLRRTGAKIPLMKWTDVFERPIQYLLESAFLVAALLLAPALIAVLLLILILGLLPIPQVRSGVGKLQRGLAATVGDSYALLGKEIVGGAILGKVRRDLNWLARKCSKVAVVAHSQGAAIAHTVLQTGAPEQCKILITLGSGLRKLSEIRRVLDTHRGTLLLWILCVVVVALVFLLRSLTSYLGIGAGLTAAVLMVVLALFGQRVTSRIAATLIAIRHGHRDLAFALPDWVAKRAEAWPKIASAGAVVCIFGWLLALFPLVWFIPGWLPVPLSQASGEAEQIDPEVGVTPRILSLLFTAGLLVGVWCMWRWREATGKLFAVIPDWVKPLKDWRDKSLDLPEPIEWIDLYASADPVPNGPLFHPELRPPRMSQDEMYNRGSALSDHSTYWKNCDQFVARVACEVCGMAGIQFGSKRTGALLPRLAQRRRSRVKELACARWLVLLGCIALLTLRWEDFTTIGQSWIANVGKFVAKLPVLGSWLSRAAAWASDGNLVALIPGTAILLGSYYLTFGAWSVWDSSESKVLFDREKEPAWSARFILFSALTFAILGYEIWHGADWMWSWWSHVAIATTALALGLVASLTAEWQAKLPER